MKLYKRKPNPEACNPNGYQAMIGCHMYKMSATESDITYTIGVPSRYTHDPSNEQMVALARMFQYPESMKCWTLHFGGALGAALRGEGAGTHACYIHSYYTGCHDGNCSTSGQVIMCTGAVNWTSRKRQLTAQSMTDAEHSDISVGRMRLTKISYLLNVLSIPTFHHVFSYSQSLIVSIKRRIYHRTAAAQNAIKYYLTTDIARYGEIVLGYTPTAVMLANCSTQPLPNPRFLNQCAGMGMISVWLGNVLANALGHGRGNRIGIGICIHNAIRKYIEWPHCFQGDPRCLIGSLSSLFTLLCELDMIAFLEQYWAAWEYGYHYAKDYDVTCPKCG